MKSFALLILILCSTINAQFKITFTDHSITSDGDIIITVFAQNLGYSQEIWSVYGIYDRFKEEMQTNFFLSYVDIMNDDKIRETIPSSIVIKTIFETYISMDSPTYYFSSTGLGSGQEWMITFTDVPLDAGSVSIVVLGSELDLGDMPKADELRKRADELRKIKEALLSDAINMALEKSQSKQWKEAANYWENAIGLKSTIINKYSEIISISFCEKAKILYAENSITDAINYFEKAKKINEAAFNKYRDDYSNLQYDYGEKLLIASDINTGIESLKYSYFLSNINKEKIENRLDEMKKSQITSVTLSIIPGLSQYVLQNNPVKSLVLFGAFTISSILTVSNKIKADNYYDEYLVASTPQDALAKYELADKQIKEAALYLGLVITTVVISIVDQYLETSYYNSLFEIKPELTTSLNNPNNYSFYLSINIPF